MSKISVDDRLEKQLLDEGYDYVVGLDEVGRGSWAGPVVVGAFVYHKRSTYCSDVNDSKKLTKLQREKIYKILKTSKHSIKCGSVKQIDEINIFQTINETIRKIILELNLDNYIALIDGKHFKKIPGKYKCIVNGDGKHYSIAAASVIAKVYRDNLMKKYAKKYTKYGFDTNSGYGTKKHREALKKFGICEIHRKSYKPIKIYCKI